MRFQITGPGWPLDGGAWLAPAGTIFDYDKPGGWASRVARGVIPINATPLDQEAWEAQQRAYPNHKHLLGGPPTGGRS
jgi:hypothetical protein